jgi:hypothetical protein
LALAISAFFAICWCYLLVLPVPAWAGLAGTVVNSGGTGTRGR